MSFDGCAALHVQLVPVRVRSVSQNGEGVHACDHLIHFPDVLSLPHGRIMRRL